MMHPHAAPRHEVAMIFILGAAGKEVGETTRIVGKARQRRGVDVGMPNKSTVSRHAHFADSARFPNKSAERSFCRLSSRSAFVSGGFRVDQTRCMWRKV